MNEKALRFVLKRDTPAEGPLLCAFCDEPFKRRARGGDMMVFDHLDNNSKNHVYDNLALVHQKCNQKKRTFGDYQIAAVHKRVANAAYVPPVEALADGLDRRENENVRIGHSLSKAAEDWLEVNCPAGAMLDFGEAAETLAYLCQQRFGYGTPETMKRHLRVHTCGAAPWALSDVEGRQVITRRAGADSDE